MQNPHDIPGISVEPPTDPHALVNQWGPESFQFIPGQGSFMDRSGSAPQDIPRINTRTDSGFTGSPGGIWEARSPASSESGYSNPSSPNFDFAEFQEEGSDYGGDAYSFASNQQFSETFDLDQFLDLATVQSQPPISPQWATSPDSDFMSGPDPSPVNNSPPPSSPFTHQSMAYGSPYSMNNMHNQNQSSSSYGAVPSGNIPFTGGNARDMVMRPAPPTHHSSSDFLSPPSPSSLRRTRSSRGPTGHRHTLSDVPSSSHSFNPNQPLALSQGSGSPISDQFLGVDFHGPGLMRSRSAPDQGKVGMRGRSPYERPSSQTGMHNATAPLDIIPRYVDGRSLQAANGSTTPDLAPTSSPSSINEGRGVATPAMLAAAEKRRKNPAKYKCPQCGSSFTAENSRKRHIASHSGEKPFLCSKLGCGQCFSNDDDRKRHETKSKKHTQ